MGRRGEWGGAAAAAAPPRLDLLVLGGRRDERDGGAGVAGSAARSETGICPGTRCRHCFVLFLFGSVWFVQTSAKLTLAAFTQSRRVRSEGPERVTGSSLAAQTAPGSGLIQTGLDHLQQGGSTPSLGSAFPVHSLHTQQSSSSCSGGTSCLSLSAFSWHNTPTPAYLLFRCICGTAKAFPSRTNSNENKQSHNALISVRVW